MLCKAKNPKYKKQHTQNPQTYKAAPACKAEVAFSWKDSMLVQ